MMKRFHLLMARHAQRATALLTALIVLAGTVGIPLPKYETKDTSRPFPCMHHACGCASAEACWQGCCCMTHEQKLAWAKEHDVTPPAEFASLASRPKGRCCSAENCTEDAAEQPAGDLTIQLVTIEGIRQCQGLTSLWLVLSQALPPSGDDEIETDLTLVFWLAPASNSPLASPALDPATPPPRAA